jgi:hypothetical protein
MRILFLLSLIALLAISCKKTVEPAPHQNTFSAIMNGTSFVSGNTEVDISGSSLPGTRAVHIIAKDVNQRELLLYMYGYDGTKSTFTLGQSGSTGAFFPTICFICSSSSSTSGEISIASFNKTIQAGGEVITGTFQFEADGTAGKYSITNGKFSVFVPN